MIPEGVPLAQVTGVPGWETPNEQELLLYHAKMVPQGGVIVEIGAEYGMSASLFHYWGHLHHVRVVSVDIMQDWRPYSENLRAAGFSDRIESIKGDSAQAGASWERTPIDLLFIDGDHSYAGVKRDIEAWTPWVREGGYVLFHDVASYTNLHPHPSHHEVRQAIMEWFAIEHNKWEYCLSIDTVQVYQRKWNLLHA